MNTRLNFNSALCKNIDTPSIAAAPLLIISVKDETILPEYLNIYINSVECQNYMKSVSCGGAVPFVSANEVCRIEIPMLNIEKQRSIIKFNSLYKKERYLLSEIVRLRAKMHKQIINNLIFN